MRTALLIPAALGLLFATGCTPATGGDATAYREALPDERVKVNLPTEDASDARVGEWSEFYLLTAEVTGNVNGMAEMVLGTVDAVTELEPTWSAQAPAEAEGEVDAVAQWGPYDGDALDPTASQLIVAHTADDYYYWVIQQRPKNDLEAAFVDVVMGVVEPGATAEASRGAFGIDFGAAHALNPNSDPPQGQFVLTYDIGATGVSAEAAFAEFLDENGNVANAMYTYDQVHEGDGAMDLAIETDMDPASTAKEVLVVRSRWQPTGAGRSDVYVVGGDLGEFVGMANDCWGTDFQSSYWADNITNGDGSIFEEGDATTCVFAEPEYDEEALAESE